MISLTLRKDKTNINGTTARRRHSPGARTLVVRESATTGVIHQAMRLEAKDAGGQRIRVLFTTPRKLTISFANR